jgi:hypothetical protein
MGKGQKKNQLNLKHKYGLSRLLQIFLFSFLLISTLNLILTKTYLKETVKIGLTGDYEAYSFFVPPGEEAVLVLRGNPFLVQLWECPAEGDFENGKVIIQLIPPTSLYFTSHSLGYYYIEIGETIGHLGVGVYQARSLHIFGASLFLLPPLFIYISIKSSNLRDALKNSASYKAHL